MLYFRVEYSLREDSSACFQLCGIGSSNGVEKCPERSISEHPNKRIEAKFCDNLFNFCRESYELGKGEFPLDSEKQVWEAMSKYLD